MRSVSSAICTSGEPVSPSWVRNWSIRLFFRSTASGIEDPPIAAPQGACAPTPGWVPKSSFFVNRYARRVPRGRAEVKLAGAGHRSRTLTRRGHVEGDLLAQRIDAWELSLLAQTAKESRRTGEIAPLKRSADLRRRHRDPIHHQCRHDVSAKSERIGQALQQAGVAASAPAEAMVEPDDDLPRLQCLNEDVLNEGVGLDGRDSLGEGNDDGRIDPGLRSEEHTSELQSRLH